MMPIAAPGTQVAAFAEALDHPRWLYVLPNGDVLVAESNELGSDLVPDYLTSVRDGGFYGWPYS